MIVRLLRILMAVAIFIFATGAQAQGQDPKLWYVAIGAGGAWYQDVDFGTGANASMSPGFTLNGAFGRYIDDIRVIRLEGEVLYDRSNIGDLSGVSASGTVSNGAVMFNAIYDIRFDSPWVPYLGGGLGYAIVDFDNFSSGGVTLLDDSAAAFAWQFKGGVAYEFSPSWVINVGYRYYQTDNLEFTDPTGARVSSGGTRIQSAEVGLRVLF